MLNKTIIILLILGVRFGSAQSALTIEGVVITVSNLDVSAKFYQDVLDFKKTREYTLKGTDFQRLIGLNNHRLYAHIVELELGDEVIALQEFINEKQARAIPPDSRSNDLWFQHIAIVTGDMDKAYEQLKNAGVVHVSPSPQTLPEYLGKASGIKAFYFQDPDGHILEIIHFPKDKGDPKWQKTQPGTFIGIDHTAIGIKETIPSKTFYEQSIGLKLLGQSENYGREQEYLNQVFGARLLISGLKAKDGIGLEFLDYIAPPGGRTYPRDSAPTDLWHWNTVIRVTNISETYKRLQEENSTIISSGVVTIDNRKQFMLRDPDGHAIVLIE